MNLPRDPRGDEAGLEPVMPVAHSAPEALPQGATPAPPYQNAYAYAYKDGSSAPPEQNQPEGRRLLGLRRPTLFLALALALAVAAIAVVAGVLGSRVASRCPDTSCPPDDSPPSTATSTNSVSPSTSSSSDFTVPTDVTVALDCAQPNPVKAPRPDGSGSYSYTLSCGEDCGGGDITVLSAYRLDMCMEACLHVNDFGELPDDTACVGVVFAADLGANRKYGGNCWLKSQCDEERPKNGVRIARAILTTG